MKKTLVIFGVIVMILSTLCGCAKKEEKYATNQIELSAAKVDQFMDYTETYNWGVSDIAIKNTGNKTINAFKLLVTFYDKDGNPVADNEVGIEPDTPLKAGYSWQQPSDIYYELENVPDTADTSNYEISVVEVSFAE